MDVDLTEKTAIITGAGRGIGYVIAERFAEAGANVVAVARTEAEIDAVIEMITETYNVDGLALPTDLRRVNDITTIVDETVEAIGVPDILINNAGANIVKPPLDCTNNEVETMLDVNLQGLFLLAQEFGVAYRDAELETGRIINISSVVAALGIPAMTFYAGTKAGVRGLTRGLAAEFARDGITVNSVSPGLTRIDRTETVIEERGDEVFDLDRIPMGRLATPDDIANACLFLASESAGYITGEDMLIDGGVAFTAGLYQ